MIPISPELIRQIHEERIRGSLIPRPDSYWEVARPARPSRLASAGRQLRISVAQALRWFAARVERKREARNLGSAARNQG
jgi:hypothetical protein